jgi:hypothetical protein
MYWKLRRGRIRDAVRDCDFVQHAAQLQVAKEYIMGKHEHAFSLPAGPGQNMQRDVRGPSVLLIGSDKRDSPTDPEWSPILPQSGIWVSSGWPVIRRQSGRLEHFGTFGGSLSDAAIWQQLRKKCGNFRLADHILGTLKMSVGCVKFANHPESTKRAATNDSLFQSKAAILSPCPTRRLNRSQRRAQASGHSRKHPSTNNSSNTIQHEYLT